MSYQDDLRAFAVEFREGLIGIQAKASQRMCAVVSMPLRAAFKVLRGVETDLVTEDGHTFLVTTVGQFKIDPTIDQFYKKSEGLEPVLVESQTAPMQADEHLSTIPFIELIEQFKRLYAADGLEPSARDAGKFVANYIYYPLAQQGYFSSHTQ